MCWKKVAIAVECNEVVLNFSKIEYRLYSVQRSQLKEGCDIASVAKDIQAAPATSAFVLSHCGATRHA